MTSDRCCVLYTKPARAGRVKTRLIGPLSAAAAADLHRAFVEDLVSRLQERECDLQLAWAVESDDEIPAVGVPGFRQVGEDLGTRLFNGLRHVGASYSRTAAIGSDHPEIPGSRIDEAFDLLEECDLVVGPARDGGYYLIAVRNEMLDPRLFAGVEWSTSRVLDQTLERSRQLGLRVRLLEEGDDVDSPEDFDRLTRFLASSDHDCPSTANLLRGWGMLP